MASELKPCPFCGYKELNIRHGKYSWVISCVNADCGASVTRVLKTAAIEAWNKRVPETVVNQFGENCTHISNCGTLNLNL